MCDKAAGGPMTQEPTTQEPTAEDEVARAAAQDVARLLDRRGLKDVVALARRVLRDAQLRAPSVAVPRGSDT
ncbi:hypothetical protein ACQPWY_28635 [Pseudonocardia xinjiangensis]|uniref:hypothetical protein n=1 Tax=Pseudonocardia xinjiangensis TaxID=75289 RepID=UPI003D8C2702